MFYKPISFYEYGQTHSMITYIIWLHLKSKNVYIWSVCEYFKLVSLSSSTLWPNHAFMQSKKNNRSIKLSITEFQSFASFVPSSCDGRDSIHPTKTKLQTRNNEYLDISTWIGFVWFMIFAIDQLSLFFVHSRLSEMVAGWMWPNSHTRKYSDLLPQK